MEESVDQLKKQRIIEHLELAISDLQKFGSNPLIINSMAQLHDVIVLEYNALYASGAAEPEEAEDEDVKKEKK